MFFIDELRENAVWGLGDFAGKSRGKNAVARADLYSAAVRGIGFGVRFDREGHPRHASVGPWPAPKDEQKALALELCVKAALVVRS